jgi:hypothetical protein
MPGERSGVAFQGQALCAPREPSATFKFRGHRVAIHHAKRSLDLGAARGVLIAQFVIQR